MNIRPPGSSSDWPKSRIEIDFFLPKIDMQKCIFLKLYLLYKVKKINLEQNLKLLLMIKVNVSFFFKGAGNSLWMLEFMCIFTQDLMMCFGRAMRVFVLPPPPSVPLPSSPPCRTKTIIAQAKHTLYKRPQL